MVLAFGLGHQINDGQFRWAFDHGPGHPPLPRVRPSQPANHRCLIRKFDRRNDRIELGGIEIAFELFAPTPIPRRGATSCVCRGRRRVGLACTPPLPASDQATSRAYAKFLCAFHPVPRSASRRRSRFNSFGRRQLNSTVSLTWSSQEARQPTMRRPPPRKNPLKQWARKSSRQDGCASRPGRPPKFRRRLRNLGGRRPVTAGGGCIRNFYVADLPSISSDCALRRSLARFLRCKELSVG